MRVGLYPSREDWTEARHAAGITSSSHDDMHAGELETSILLAAHPSYLRDGWHTSDHAAPDRRYLTTSVSTPTPPAASSATPPAPARTKARQP